MVNVIIMAMRYDNMPDTMAKVLYYGNIFFVILFTIEAVLKIYGIGPTGICNEVGTSLTFFLLLPAILACLLGQAWVASRHCCVLSELQDCFV